MRSLYTSVLTDRSALSLLGSNLLGVVALTSWTLYIVPFFQQTYGIAQGLASTYALVQSGGMLVGSQIGGRLGGIGQKQLLCAWVAGERRHEVAGELGVRHRIAGPARRLDDDPDQLVSAWVAERHQ